MEECMYRLNYCVEDDDLQQQLELLEEIREECDSKIRYIKMKMESKE